ncbi:porin family protein [bacterium]|nr:porin family protein [bacterium]
MNATLSKIIGWLVAVLLLPCSIASAAPPEQTPQGKREFYIGFALPYNSMRGDFDGHTILEGTNQSVHIPKIEDDFGYEIILGLNFSKGFTRLTRDVAEISYIRSTHDVKWTGTKSSAAYSMINFDAKSYFFPERRIQPFFLFGVAVWSSIAAKNAAESYPYVGEAQFWGQGFHAGFGVAYFVHPRIAISGDVLLRYILFHATMDDIDEEINGVGVSFNAGLTYTVARW